MNIHFPVDVNPCVDAQWIQVLGHSFQPRHQEKSDSHRIFCNTSTVCSQSYMTSLHPLSLLPAPPPAATCVVSAKENAKKVSYPP